MHQYDDWNEYEGASEGSGRSEKIWLQNDAGEIGLFKYTKSSETTEHISEKLAYELAGRLELPCARVEIGTYGSKIGSMSYLINNQDEILIEGISLINKKYPHYNTDNMYDDNRHEYYSLEMILNSIQEYNLEKDFLKIVIFDFLIGNTDRHQSNWAVLQKGDNIKICPIYDNGSSLCCYVMGDKIKSYLGNDIVRLNSLVDTKSRSRIRIDKYQRKEPTHYELLKYVLTQHREAVLDFAYLVQSTINEETLVILLNTYDNKTLGSDKKELIKKFVMGKISLLRKVL